MYEVEFFAVASTISDAVQPFPLLKLYPRGVNIIFAGLHNSEVLNASVVAVHVSVWLGSWCAGYG
jgi:hypothetical protein